MGEFGLAGEVFFKLKAGSTLGGHYGTNVAIAGSRIKDIARTAASNAEDGYESQLFSEGTQTFYEDASIEITHKIKSGTKVILSYYYQVYNKNVIEGKINLPMITANTVVADITQKITDKHSVRIEAQHLMTAEDKGNWAMLLAEFSVAPNWSLYAADEYNYGNEVSSHRFHYYSGGLAFSEGPTRISLSYARQRGGLLCVGGVCRQVFASNGFNLVITSRF